MPKTTTIQCPNGHPVEAQPREQKMGDKGASVTITTSGTTVHICKVCGPFFLNDDGSVRPVVETPE